MRTVAVVPLNSLQRAKSRLGGVLSPDERMELMVSMLGRVLGALTESGAVEAIAVISPEAGAVALPAGVHMMTQRRQGLNNLLEQGREWAYQQGADALMVVFADLPLLAPEDIARIAELGREEGTVVLAPDRRGQGTNVLLSHPVELASFAFGPYSFEKHQAEAREAGAQLEIYSSPGTSLDIDTPDDLAEMNDRRSIGARE